MLIIINYMHNIINALKDFLAQEPSAENIGGMLRRGTIRKWKGKRKKERDREKERERKQGRKEGRKEREAKAKSAGVWLNW
jgi:hypothetical protein